MAAFLVGVKVSDRVVPGVSCIVTSSIHHTDHEHEQWYNTHHHIDVVCQNSRTSTTGNSTMLETTLQNAYPSPCSNEQPFPSQQIDRDHLLLLYSSAASLALL